MTAAAGYSGTPLAQKLGLKDGQRVLFVSLPPSLNELRVSRHFLEARAKARAREHNAAPYLPRGESPPARGNGIPLQEAAKGGRLEQ